MELDSRKKDRMMRSNSFDTQKVREIGRKEAGELKRLSNPIDENNRKCLPDGKKESENQERLKM